MNGLKFLLDTNVVIGILDGRQPALDLVQQNGARLNECAVSQITRMELLSFPAISAPQEAAFRQFLSSVTVLLIEQAAEDASVSMRKARKLKLPDAIIGGTAKA